MLGPTEPAAALRLLDIPVVGSITLGIAMFSASSTLFHTNDFRFSYACSFGWEILWHGISRMAMLRSIILDKPEATRTDRVAQADPDAL